MKNKEEFEISLFQQFQKLYPHRRIIERVPSKHESIPYCDGSGREACVACSEEVDKCVPFPCGREPHEDK